MRSVNGISLNSNHRASNFTVPCVCNRGLELKHSDNSTLQSNKHVIIVAPVIRIKSKMAASFTFV